jgi:hypothetical protein
MRQVVGCGVVNVMVYLFINFANIIQSSLPGCRPTDSILGEMQSLQSSL